MNTSCLRSLAFRGAMAVFLPAMPCLADEPLRIFAGTWSLSGEARVLLYESDTDWTELPFPVPVRGVWDLEWHDGHAWAATGEANVIWRLDGTTWTEVSSHWDSEVTGLGVANGMLHATVRETGLLRHDGGTTWTALAELEPVGRLFGSDAHEGRDMLFMGEDRDDEFWVHDPDGLLGCSLTCPPLTGEACSAGCFGGSCVFSFTDFDDGTGATVYAGAYEGGLFAWDGAGETFERLLPDVDTGHLQALAAFDGRAWTGSSEGRLFSNPSPRSLPWTEEHDFGPDEPVSALLAVDDLDELWVGFGGVPFRHARHRGTSTVRSFDGTTWRDRGVLGAFDDGVPALLAVPGDALFIDCDAGPSRVVECEGVTTSVTLDGSGSSVTGGTGALPSFEWSGPFAGSPVTGDVVEVPLESPGEHELTLVVSADGESASCTTTVTLTDTLPPAIVGAPSNATVDCDAIPAPASPVASDACDPAPSLEMSEDWIEGPCPDAGTLVRRWIATDAAGHATVEVRRLWVQDVTPPVLHGVPEDRVADCADVPEPPPVTASDGCDPAPVVTFSERRIDGPCAGTYRLERTWKATDRCGNETESTRVVDVQDTTPPSVAASGAVLHCLWPPNHRFACFSREDFAPRIEDDCSEPVSWRIEGCASSQPDDDRGDGRTLGDCSVSADGSELCARSERDGRDPAGRLYAVLVVATDACGNESEPVRIGDVHVPHDAREGAARTCRTPGKAR